MTTEKICILIAVVVYMLFVLFVGIFYSKKNKSTDDFYLGGRKLGALVTAMSAEASDMSGWLLLGLPGVALLTGIAEATWTAIGLAIGTWLNWFFVAKRIRRYSSNISAITIPDYFSKRYNDKKNILMMVSAVIIIVFFIPYTASGFKACGALFSSLFGIDYHLVMIICAAVIIAYTVVGGFLAASITDFIQSIVMTIALISILIFGVTQAGGFNSIIEKASENPEYVSLVQSFNVFTQEVGGYGFLPIVSTLAWGLGYFGMPHILLRFMAIKDERKLSLSRRVGTIWVVISMGVAIIIGIVGYAMIQNGAMADFFNGVTAEGASARSEEVVIRISNLLSTFGIGAALLAGVVMAGIFASTMSTSDSQLLAAASSVSENLLKPTIFKNLTPKQGMWIARITVVIVSIVGVLLAWDPNSSVFRIVSFAWAGFGGAFGPVVLFSLFWRRSNKWGALAGMVSGAGMIFIWKYLIRPLGGAWDIYELLPAFIVASIFIVVISLVTKPPEKEVLDQYDEYKKGKNNLVVESKDIPA